MSPKNDTPHIPLQVNQKAVEPEKELLKYAQNHYWNEPLFKTLVEMAPIGITLSSSKRDLDYSNQAFANTVGYTQEELYGIDWSQLTFEEDRSANLDTYQKLVSGEIDSFEFEKRYWHKAGHLVWCKLRVTLVQDMETGKKLTLALIQDITEEKLLSEHFVQQKHMMHLGEEVAGIGTFIWNTKTNETEASPGVLQIFELDPETTHSGNLFEKAMALIHPEDVEKVFQDVTQSAKENLPIITRYRIRFPDGREKWLKTIPGPFIDEDRMLRTIQDVTEQERKNTQLSRQNNMLEMGVHGARLASFVWNAEKLTILSTHGVKELYEIDTESFSPKGLFDKIVSLTHPEDLETLQTNLGKVIKGEPAIQFDVRIITDTNEVKWVRIFPCRSLYGKEKLATVQDITEDVSKSALLKRQNEFIQIGEETSGMGTFIWNVDTREMLASPGLYRLSGLNPDDYDGKTLFERLVSMAHPDDKASLDANLKFIAENRELSPIEFRVVLDSGEVKWLRTSPGKFLSENEKLGTVQDITEEKRKSQILEQQEEMVRLGGESGNIGVDIWNIETGDFIYSPNLLKMFHLNPEVVTRKNLLEKLEERFHPEDREKVHDFTADLLKNPKERAALIHRILLPNGETRWMQVISDRFKDTNARITINKDITEYIQQSEKLRESQQEIEQLLYTVSHDLRAPLRHVSSYAQMLQVATVEKLDEEEARNLNNVLSASNRLGIMIDELLQFFRNKHVEIAEEPVDLGEITRSMQALFSSDTEQRRIEWSIGTLPVVIGDYTLLEKVMLNLISNAVKFTSKTEQARIEISAKALDEMTLITVQDNGAGFKMKYIDKLFNVFQRLHKRRDFEGTGIGLANVKRIIEKHGGTIWAEAEVGNGAKFYFTLRLYQHND